MIARNEMFNCIKKSMEKHKRAKIIIWHMASVKLP